jgi:1-pyrroline-5-carboxylate dehydrogenase
MINLGGNYHVPKPSNEPVYQYIPGDTQRLALKAELEKQSKELVSIPLIINGEEIHTEKRNSIAMPHNHRHILANCSQAGEQELKYAIESAMAAKNKWENMPWEHRSAVFLKAAELAGTKYRAKLCAATMLGQSKVAYQAEIDAACEFIDFLRYNVYYADQIYRQQPESSKGQWNRVNYRPLEGFVLAVTPYNFTAISMNLAVAPAIAGNTVIWKPAGTAVLSSYYAMKLLEEAGLPAGVINFVPSSGADISRYVVSDPRMAGFHFTGSTEVFSSVSKYVEQSIGKYDSYPRLVGETGGKDYIFAHSSADIPALCAAMIRGAFEYQGQKCSALSRAFIPETIWPELREKLLDGIKKLRVGDVMDFRSFMSAVIDEKSFIQLKSVIDEANDSPYVEVLCGGYDDSKGYFIYPTLLLAKKRDYETMLRELFGPILTIYVYPESELDETLRFCDTSTPFALTGAIFARDREAIAHMEYLLRHSAGNFYINDKPTGAVVGQQPFGGARASGTNDKAGSALNLYRWMSLMTIKENFATSDGIDYPYMREA